MEGDDRQAARLIGAVSEPTGLFDAWQAQIAKGRPASRIRACSASGCLAPMLARDQMALQWSLITAGIEEVLGSTLARVPIP